MSSNSDAWICGKALQDIAVHRDERSKWFLLPWLGIRLLPQWSHFPWVEDWGWRGEWDATFQTRLLSPTPLLHVCPPGREYINISRAKECNLKTARQRKTHSINLGEGDGRRHVSSKIEISNFSSWGSPGFGKVPIKMPQPGKNMEESDSTKKKKKLKKPKNLSACYMSLLTALH